MSALKDLCYLYSHTAIHGDLKGVRARPGRSRFAIVLARGQLNILMDGTDGQVVCGQLPPACDKWFLE